MIYAHIVIFLKLQTIIFSIVQFTASNVYNYSATPPASLKLKHPSFWGLLVYVFKNITIVNAVYNYIKSSKRFTT